MLEDLLRYHYLFGNLSFLNKEKKHVETARNLRNRKAGSEIFARNSHFSFYTLDTSYLIHVCFG